MAILKSVSDWWKKKVAEPVQGLASKEASVWSGRIGDIIRGAEKAGQGIYNVGEKAGQGLYNIGQQMGGGVQFIKENLPSGLQSLGLAPTLAGFKDVGQKLTGGVKALKSLATTGNILGAAPPIAPTPAKVVSGAGTVTGGGTTGGVIGGGVSPIKQPSQAELDIMAKIKETQDKIAQYQDLIKQTEATGYGPKEDVIDLATMSVKPRDVLSTLQARTGATSDYRTQMMEMITNLQKQQQDYISTLQNMPSASQTYQDIRTQLGLPGAEERLTGLQGQMQSTENLLTTLEKDINARASGMGVSQPMLNRELAMEQRPLQEQLAALSRAAGVEQTGVTSLRDQLSQMLQLSGTEQERQAQIAGLPMQYSAQMIPMLQSMAQYQSPEEKSALEIQQEQLMKQLGLGSYAKAPETIGGVETGIFQWDSGSKTWKPITTPSISTTKPSIVGNPEQGVWQYDPATNSWNQVIAGTTTTKLTEADKVRLGYAGIGMMNLGKLADRWGIATKDKSGNILSIDWKKAPGSTLLLLATPGQPGARTEQSFIKEALMNYAFAQSGKQMSWKEVEMRYKNFIPQIGDSISTMRTKLQNLQDSIMLITQTGLMPTVESGTASGSAGGLAQFEE